jgi:hypothetical protein
LNRSAGAGGIRLPRWTTGPEVADRCRNPRCPFVRYVIRSSAPHPAREEDMGSMILVKASAESEAVERRTVVEGPGIKRARALDERER